MKILILNWRDPKSSLEGGAERFTKKYGEYWSKSGHEVYWLTNSFAGSANRETIDGITYLRISPALDGSLLKYIFLYPIFLLKSIWHANQFIKNEGIDLVIDEIHGFPFFTPLFSPARNVLLVCEVAGPIWDKMFPFPFNIIGKYTEKFIYKLYANTEIWAISENTKKNIQEILPKKKVKVIDLGVDENKEILEKIRDVKKTSYPSAVFLARLVKMKGIETALLATGDIVKTFPNFKLFVIGSGSESYMHFLQNLVSQLQIEKNVEFLGKVSELDKFQYLKKAHFLLHPSYKEGFGLTVLEAGLVGTPAIVRAGSGMEGLVKNRANGFEFVHKKEIGRIVAEYAADTKFRTVSEDVRKSSSMFYWKQVLSRSNKILRVD